MSIVFIPSGTAVTSAIGAVPHTMFTINGSPRIRGLCRSQGLGTPVIDIYERVARVEKKRFSPARVGKVK